MHKHLKSRVTAALVAGGLVGLAAQPAHAESILFPYLSTQSGVFSFVTVANLGLFEVSDITGYHFTYGHKANPVANKKGCSHFDGNVTTTPGDMMTFEVNGKVSEPGGALFEGGSTAPVTSQALQLPVANQTTFLAVEARGQTGPENSNEMYLMGWAEVIDTAGNMTLAYSTHNFGVNGSTDPNFATSLVGDIFTYLSWYPASLVTTSWHVLPMGALSTMVPAGGGGIRAAVGIHPLVSGAYDRDEQRWSGTKTAAVRCFGFITRADLLQPATLTQTDGGGWTITFPANVTTAPTDPDDPSQTYTGQQNLIHRIQAATAATGLAPRSAINREPMAVGPGYNMTLDPGP